MEVELGFADGSTSRVPIRMIGRTAQFALPSDQDPSSVTLDPDGWILLEAQLTRK